MFPVIVCPKIIENIVHTKLVAHLTNFNVINMSWHDLFSQKLTTTKLLVFKWVGVDA